MIFVQHRVNNIEALAVVNSSLGVEIDLRESNGEIILSHDPFNTGPRLNDWLMCYSGKLLILNIKEMGIEKHVVEIIRNQGAIDYVLLDLAFPYLRRAIKSDFTVAARVSEFESLDEAINTGAKWLWLDSFTGDWSYLKRVVERKKSYDFRTCLVSPELQERSIGNGVAEFEFLVKLIQSNEGVFDAICTKSKDTWEKGFKIHAE